MAARHMSLSGLLAGLFAVVAAAVMAVVGLVVVLLRAQRGKADLVATSIKV